MADRIRKLDRVVSQRFTVSCMSDAKWRKTFRTLAALEPRPHTCRWKFVGDERTFETSLPTFHDLEDTHLVDGRFQPFVYKDIEWIEIVTGNQAQVIDALTRVGAFEIEVTADGVRLYGYR